MYQFSVQVQDSEHGFDHVIDDLKRRLSPLPAGSLLFHIYSMVFSTRVMSDLIGALRGQFDGCQIICCTVSGGVVDYAYQPGIVISAVAFERRDSRAEVHTYDLTSSSDKAVAEEINRYVRENPWVKAVELYRTRHDMYTSDLCEVLSELPEDIVAFGGIVSAERIESDRSYLADQSGRLMDRGIAAVYYGGSDLRIKACRMSGWKPIDKPFTVTKAENNIIKEIDGAPANAIYKRYLDINPDDSFVMNALEFPLLSEERGSSVVRNVVSLDPEGGFAIACKTNVGTRLRICYADAESVAENINAVSWDLMLFAPDVISVVSCITRSLIWQRQDYMPELQGFRSVAPCHGYLSHGEFLREDGIFNHHNTILVAAAFREGDLKDVSFPEPPQSVSSAIPLTARLSTFISRVTDELKDQYSRVERVATTDGLTQIGNRYLFDAAVKAAAADAARANTKYLLMFDLNELKFVNDTFGHLEGDQLIKTAANTISNAFSRNGQCFRIGGDEFAVIADFKSEAALRKALSDFRDGVLQFNKTSHYALSVAVGYAALIDAQGKTLSTSEWRSTADINMYKDKAKFHSVKPSYLSQNMIEFIACIMSLLDNKNGAFAYHSERVQRMAIMIAKLMRLEDATIERIKLGSYLHDIGRIGISDTMVSKEDPLTDADRKLLRQLPGIGRRLLMASDETKEIANIVYASYEHWDGGGYPEGLSGRDIPTEARIIAVADFIDTVLHDGFGMAALTPDECLRELQKNSGTMFDPDVISVVLANFEALIRGELPV